MDRQHELYILVGIIVVLLAILAIFAGIPTALGAIAGGIIGTAICLSVDHLANRNKPPRWVRDSLRDSWPWEDVEFGEITEGGISRWRRRS